MKKLVLQHALVMVAYFFVAIILTYPLISHLNNKLYGDGGDNFEFFGFQYTAWHSLSQIQYPFGNTNLLRYPVGFNLGSGSDGYIPILLGALLTIFVGSITAYNLSILVLITINAYCSHLLFRFVSQSEKLAYMGALTYGFSSYVLARANGHLNMLFIAGLPLLLFAILRLPRSAKKFVDYGLIGISLLMIIGASLQYFIMVAVSTSIIFSLGLMFRLKTAHDLLRALLRNKKSLLLSLTIFLGCLAIIVFPTVKLLVSGELQWQYRDNVIHQSKPNPLNLILPNPYTKTLQSNLFAVGEPSIEQVFFVGLIEIILFTISLRKGLAHKDSRFIFIVLATFLALTIGVGYGSLSRIFPFTAIPEFGRFFVVFYLFFMLFVVKSFRNMGSSWALWGATICIPLLLLERFPLTAHESSIPQGDWISIVANQPGSAVLDLPVDPYNSVYNFLPSVYRKPIVSGYFHWTGDTPKTRAFIQKEELSRFICYPDDSNLSPESKSISFLEEARKNDNLLKLLKQYDIQTIVLHLDRKYHHPVCADAKKHANVLLPKINVATPNRDPQGIFQFFLPAITYFNYQIVFPQDGTFTTDGILVAPTNMLLLQVTYNNQPITIFNENWTTSQYGMLWGNSGSFTLPVQAGSVLTFWSESPINGTAWVTYWYKYTVDQTTNTPTQPKLEELYRDDTTVVYQLH